MLISFTFGHVTVSFAKENRKKLVLAVHNVETDEDIKGEPPECLNRGPSLGRLLRINPKTATTTEVPPPDAQYSNNDYVFEAEGEDAEFYFIDTWVIDYGAAVYLMVAGMDEDYAPCVYFQRLPDQGKSNEEIRNEVLKNRSWDKLWSEKNAVQIDLSSIP